MMNIKRMKIQIQRNLGQVILPVEPKRKLSLMRMRRNLKNRFLHMSTRRNNNNYKGYRNGYGNNGYKTRRPIKYRKRQLTLFDIMNNKNILS